MGQFVYHFKPPKMFGHHLMALHALKDKATEAYGEEIEKYKGRETLLKRKIPLLDCLWNDVIHVSPLNPQIVLDTWDAEGIREQIGAPESRCGIATPCTFWRNKKSTQDSVS